MWLTYSLRNNCSQQVWASLSVYGGESEGHRWRAASFTEPIEVDANGSADGGLFFAFTAGGSLSSPTVPVPPIDKLFAVATSAVKPQQPLKCRSDSKVTHDLYWDTWSNSLRAEGRITNTCDQPIWSFLEVVALDSNGIAVGSGFSDGFVIKPNEGTRATVPTARLDMGAGRSIPAYTMKVFVHVKP